MAEVAQQRVAEDHDAVVEVVLRDGVALVEAVGALAPAAVGDDDRDVLERAVELEGSSSIASRTSALKSSSS